MKYFITGTPGVGKTTVGKLLEKRGHKFIDIDLEPGLASWYSNKTGKKVPPDPNADEAWYDQHEWNWEREALQNLLDSQTSENVFVSGITNNQAKDLDLFDKIFFLRTSDAELRRRMLERRAGAKDEEVDHVFKWNKSFEKKTIELGAIPIDTSQSPEKVVGEILKQVEQ